MLHLNSFSSDWRRQTQYRFDDLFQKSLESSQLGNSSLMEANLPKINSTCSLSSIWGGTNSVIQQGQINALKRKANFDPTTWDYSITDLDLNLSLKITPYDEDHDHHQVFLKGNDDEVNDNNLSLSLSSSSSKPSCKLKKGIDQERNNNGSTNINMASTLDLTL